MNNAVVIVTYNRVELLKECLACVCGQTIPFSRVIVVDNHSTDGTAEFLAAREDLDVIREPENLVAQVDFMTVYSVQVRGNMTGC